ncbi:peptidase M75 superfamily protein, partial [Flavobacteriaceae bacterium]|nr:peptidase M75 superfamily protein [Flavobacteriaceae bacterium]
VQDNLPMLYAYDVIQANVVLLKVDMLQKLNINVDYADADGD